jgi:hypothetical protein
VPKNLTLADTGEMVLRQMLGALLSPEVEACLAQGTPCSGTYQAGAALGAYQVQFLPRPRHEGGFDVMLTNALEPPPIVAPAPALDHATEDTTRAEMPRAKVSSPSAALEALLAQAVALRASDVHAREGEPAFARVDGRLVPLGGGPHDMRELIGDALAAERRMPLLG